RFEHFLFGLPVPLHRIDPCYGLGRLAGEDVVGADTSVERPQRARQALISRFHELPPGPFRNDTSPGTTQIPGETHDVSYRLRAVSAPFGSRYDGGQIRSVKEKNMGQPASGP